MQAQDRTPALNIRIKPQQRNLIEQAAEVSENTVSDFVRNAALSAAQDILLDQKTFHLEEEAWERFTAALDQPPQKNPRLRDLMNRKAPWEK